MDRQAKSSIRQIKARSTNSTARTTSRRRRRLLGAKFFGGPGSRAGGLSHIRLVKSAGEKEVPVLDGSTPGHAEPRQMAASSRSIRLLVARPGRMAQGADAT